MNQYKVTKEGLRLVNPYGNNEPTTNWARGDAAVMAGAEEQGQIVQMQINHSRWCDFENAVQYIATDIEPGDKIYDESNIDIKTKCQYVADSDKTWLSEWDGYSPANFRQFATLKEDKAEQPEANHPEQVLDMVSRRAVIDAIEEYERTKMSPKQLIDKLKNIR